MTLHILVLKAWEQADVTVEGTMEMSENCYFSEEKKKKWDELSQVQCLQREEKTRLSRCNEDLTSQDNMCFQINMHYGDSHSDRMHYSDLDWIITAVINLFQMTTE